MSILLKRLTGGERRSLGDSDEVVRIVLDAPPSRAAECIEEILLGVLGEDPIVRSRAMRVVHDVSAIHPELVQPFKSVLIEEVSALRQWEVRERLCQILTKLDLSEDEIVRIEDIFRSYLQDRSSIVRTCALQGLADLAEIQPQLRESVMAVLDEAAASGTAAMRARARKLVKRLQARA